MSEAEQIVEPKQILVTLPGELYRRFTMSPFRRESQTDAEGIRAAIKYAIENNNGSQG